PGGPDRGTIERWLQRWIATRTHQDPASVEKRRPFAEYGIDSVTAVELAEEFSNFVGTEVPATAAWDHPNIEDLTGAIVEALGRDHSNDSARVPATNGRIPENRPSGDVDFDS